MGCLLIPRRLGRSAQSLGRGDRWLWRYSIANRQYSIDNRLYWLLPVATVPLSSTSALVHRLAPLCCSVCPRPRPTGPVCEGVAVGRGRGLACGVPVQDYPSDCLCPPRLFPQLDPSPPVLTQVRSVPPLRLHAQVQIVLEARVWYLYLSPYYSDTPCWASSEAPPHRKGPERDPTHCLRAIGDSRSTKSF
jgi:hypothetical protein